MIFLCVRLRLLRANVVRLPGSGSPPRRGRQRQRHQQRLPSQHRQRSHSSSLSLLLRPGLPTASAPSRFWQSHPPPHSRQRESTALQSLRSLSGWGSAVRIHKASNFRADVVLALEVVEVGARFGGRLIPTFRGTTMMCAHSISLLSNQFGSSLRTVTKRSQSAT